MKINRRAFLKGSSAIAAGLGLGSLGLLKAPEAFGLEKKRNVVIDNHGHISKAAFRPDDIDSIEGYDPKMRLGGQSPEKFISLMDAVGVDMAVLHSPRWFNKYHARIVREHPKRFISACKINEAKAATGEASEALGKYIKDWGFKGLYYDAGPAGNDAAENYHTERYDHFWKFVSSLKIPVCFVSYTQNFQTLWPNLLTLLDKFPDLTLVIIHGLDPPSLLKEDNKVVIPDSALRLVRDHDVTLDMLPGVEKYGPNDEAIKALYDTFGSSKLMWGSEFTKVGKPTVEQYSSQRHYFEERCKYMSKDDLRLIHGENALRIYRLEK